MIYEPDHRQQFNRNRGLVFHGFTSRYERRGIYNLEEILPYIGEKNRIYDGVNIWLTSDRYLMFKEQGLVCVSCKIEGIYFGLERAAKRLAIQIPGEGRHRYEMVTDGSRSHEWHFNLYAMREDGVEIMMTKDHIIPRARGGVDKMWNYQVMCQKCNGRKGCTIPLAMSTYAGA
jgi:hypothetical protein